MGFERYTADADLTAQNAGLADDRCQYPHRGYVITGTVMFKTVGGEETFVGGDAYFVGPGHTPVRYHGTDVVEFSPTSQLQQTLEVVARNMAAG